MSSADPSLLHHGDLFHFSGTLSRESRQAVIDWYIRHDWEDIDRNWMTIETACLMLIRLQVAADDPLLFPKGKWATIQQLEQHVHDAVAGSLITSGKATK